jgi:hypothetical protein
MASEHRCTLKLPSCTSGRGDFYFDLTPGLGDVVAVYFLGYKLRATTAPQELKLVFGSEAGHTVDGYYAVGGDLNSASGSVPQAPNNNGVLLTPLLLTGGATDQSDNGSFSNQPQLILHDCGTVSRIRVSLTDFGGAGNLSQYDGHLYLQLKFVRRAPGFFSPERQVKWQRHLRDNYVGDGTGWSK